MQQISIRSVKLHSYSSKFLICKTNLKSEQYFMTLMFLYILKLSYFEKVEESGNCCCFVQLMFQVYDVSARIHHHQLLAIKITAISSEPAVGGATGPKYVRLKFISEPNYHFIITVSVI